MITIDGLAEVVLNVRDVERAAAFYGGVLALQRMTPAGQPGPLFFRAGEATDRVPAMVVLVPLAADAGEIGSPRALHHLALTIPAEAFDAARLALGEAGIEVRDGTHPVLAVRTMYVTDPDGNEVEFISPETSTAREDGNPGVLR